MVYTWITFVSMTQLESLRSSLSMSSYGSAFWIFVSIFRSGFVCRRRRCTNTLYKAWLNALPRNNRSFLTNCASSLNLANPSCDQPLPLASSASWTCWRLTRECVYCGHCVQKQLVSIQNSNHLNSSQITTRTGTWATSSFVSVPNFCAQCGQFDALWETYQTTQAHTLTSLISLAYSTCHRGA